MKNGLLRIAETLVKQAAEYGESSVQVILSAGFRCLEDVCIADHSTELSQTMTWIRVWLDFPQLLSEQQKDALSGTTRFSGLDEEQPGWESLLGAALQYKDPYKPTMIDITRSFAFILRMRDHPGEGEKSMEQSVFRFGFFLAQLLCWWGSRRNSVVAQLQQAAQDIELLRNRSLADTQALKGN